MRHDRLILPPRKRDIWGEEILPATIAGSILLTLLYVFLVAQAGLCHRYGGDWCNDLAMPTGVADNESRIVRGERR